MALADPQHFEMALERMARITGRALNELLPDSDSRIHQAMRYAALNGGKRLRPFFVLESCTVFGAKFLDSIRVSAALECVHCYSLVHDDLPAMDDDDLRRGQPTLHKKFDEATAILAGDALLTFAFELIAGQRTHPEGAIRAELVLQLAKAAGEAGMVGGQMLDIEAETSGFKSLAEISTMQRGKTGALFRFACEVGAMATGEDPTHIRQYADHIGLAFQIADDILDVESDPETLGKATQKDKSRGKATFVDFLGLEGARKEAQRLSDAAVEALAGFDSRADLLRAAARFVVVRKR